MYRFMISSELLRIVLQFHYIMKIGAKLDDLQNPEITNEILDTQLI